MTTIRTRSVALSVGEVRRKLLNRLAGSKFEVSLGVVLNADLLFKRSRRVGYVGWVGRGNLGDDVLLELYRRWCPENKFRFLPEALTPQVLRALKRLNREQVISAVLIGGGTIIGQASFRPLVETILDVYPDAPMSAIGVGVEDGALLHTSRNEGELPKWKPVLERFKAISVRGPLSRAALEAIGIDAPIVGDTGLAAANYRPDIKVQPSLVGMNISHTPYAGSRGSREAVQILTDFAHTQAMSGRHVRLFVFNEEENVHLEARLSDLSRQHGIEIVGRKIGLDRLLSRIAECHVFIGHRLHSVVLAAAMGVPAVAVEYLPKCRDFQASLGREQYSIPMGELSTRVLADMTDHLVANRDFEAQQLELAVRQRLDDLEKQVVAFGALL